MTQFQFRNPGLLADERLKLVLLKTESAEVSPWSSPAYRFEIQTREAGVRVGTINLRVGESKLLTHYAGQIGFAIDEPHRGHHYAERACRLLLPFAGMNGLSPVWITCSPDNHASRRTIERLGAEYVETVEVPADYPLPDGALRQKRRYRI
jgi:tagatose 1,6-diphosphate aldolase